MEIWIERDQFVTGQRDNLQVFTETALNYWMMVERCPNLKEEVGSSIPGCEISSLIHRFVPGGKLPPML